MMVSWMHKITGYHLFSIKLRTNMTHAIATMVHHASSMRMEDLSTIAAVVGGLDKCSGRSETVLPVLHRVGDLRDVSHHDVYARCTHQGTRVGPWYGCQYVECLFHSPLR